MNIFPLQGKQIAYIESTSSFNDFCTVPDTGMFFLAQEDVKMLTFYVPAMGPAPRWCSFLDNLTEEIESEVVENMYDDYQFVTQKELEELGLEHLIGSNLLKAYMHGYFIDARLYNRAKSIVDPFAFERFRKEKIRQEIESERKPRLQLSSKLPKVNQELALKIIEEQTNPTAKQAAKQAPNLLEDNRFKAMFENTDFSIDKNAEEYKLLAPVLNRLEKSKLKEIKKRIEVARVNELHEEENKPHEESDNDEDLFGLEKSDDDDDKDSSGAESSDDENVKEFAKEMKKAYKDVKKQRKEELEDMDVEENQPKTSQRIPAQQTNGAKPKEFKMYSLQTSAEMSSVKRGMMKVSLADRVSKVEETNSKVQTIGSSGNRQMTFDLKKKDLRKRELQLKQHREERKKLIRPIKSLKLKKVNFK